MGTDNGPFVARIKLKHPGDAGIARGHREKNERSWIYPKELVVMATEDGTLIFGSSNPKSKRNPRGIGLNTVLILNAEDAVELALNIIKGVVDYLPDDTDDPAGRLEMTRDDIRRCRKLSCYQQAIGDDQVREVI